MSCNTTTTTTAPCESPITAAELEALVPNPATMGLCEEVSSLITFREKIVEWWEFVLNDEAELSDGGKCFFCIPDCLLVTTSTSTSTTSSTTTTSTSSSTTTSTTSGACSGDEEQAWYSLWASVDFSLLIGNGQDLVLRSLNEGALWSEVDNGLASMTGISGEPDGSTLVAVANGGDGYVIKKSTDDGVSWVGVLDDLNSLVNKRVAVLSPAIYLVGGNTGVLYRTTDGATNWSPVVISSGAWMDIKYATADNTKLIAVANNDEIFISSDAGVSWSQTESARAWTCCAISSTGSVMYAATGTEIFKSSDSGVNWERVHNIESGTINQIACSSNGAVVVAPVQSGRIQVSLDSGATWQEICQVLNWRAVAVKGDGTRFMVGHFGGDLYRFSVSGSVITNL